MEIDNSRIASLVTQTSGQGAPVDRHKSGEDKAAGTAGNGQPGDQISLTDDAQRLRSLEQSLAERPVVDSQRVSAVRDAVDNGTFAVNPERIADKLLSLEQALTDAR